MTDLEKTAAEARPHQVISVAVTDETGAAAHGFTIPASHLKQVIEALRTVQAEAVQARFYGEAVLAPANEPTETPGIAPAAVAVAAAPTPTWRLWSQGPVARAE
ncbi:MAG: hypothetical protein AAFQ73_06735 [Pseudomonadota bacterium]